ncbi:5158_t:CDS:10 [Paraglomus occultum]|uniref:5158_t:CDS:1 n=1 Tax=Paraglomus occultum TaxID=144539 RepID=A0A9N9CRB9_9GLOM|nr:5158_t:CDS:10 [Paraglomus occultum]
MQPSPHPTDGNSARGPRPTLIAWEQVRRDIRAYRNFIQPSNIVNIKEFCFDDTNNCVYFLATDPARFKSSTLFVVDLPKVKRSDGKVEYSGDMKDERKAPMSEKRNKNSKSDGELSEWRPLLPEPWLQENSASETLSREELLSKERRRLALQGIANYQFEKNSGQILFNYGNGVYVGRVERIDKTINFTPRAITTQTLSNFLADAILSLPFRLSSHCLHSPSPISNPNPSFFSPQVSSAFPSTASPSSYSPSSSSNSSSHHSSHTSSPSPTPSGSPLMTTTATKSTILGYSLPRLDPKLGGRNANLIAFIRDRDIWVTTMKGYETRLTFCSENPDARREALSCGIAEYVMQEEFHRFTGYYWAPPSVNEYLNDKIERILYIQISEAAVGLVLIPRPGSHGEVEEHRYPRAGTNNAVGDLQLVEFIPRYDNGDSEIAAFGPVHKRLWGKASLEKKFPWLEYIVRFGWCPDGKSIWAQLLDRAQKRTAVVKIPVTNFMTSMEYEVCGDRADKEDIEIVFQEESDIWINVTDICYFFPHVHTLPANSSCDSPTKLLITSERTGYRHLFFITRPTPSSSYNLRQITSGDWPVVDRPIFVDPVRELVYFTAKKDTFLETHLYVASFSPSANPTAVVRLTELGYSHVVIMDEKCEKFLDWFSSTEEKPRCMVRYLEWRKGNIFPNVSERVGVSIGYGLAEDDEKDDGREEEKKVPAGEFFEFVNSDGVTIHGCLYRPENYVPGKIYPTLLNIYGGPKSQMVTNDYKYPRFLRLFLASKLGFCVVLIDGRGSSDRGIAFEAHLRNRMGTVELEDQIAGLRYLSSRKMGVDLTRVAITGWSYGGYLSLMALAQHPDVFKLAIAGAPVSQWELYDTAYTERYMGLPSDNVEGYRRGSVLYWADNFPDSENRLLIAHGQIDENVHFEHSERLVAALVKYNKPHVLQPYPNERHGLRHANVAEHFETLMFFWLMNYL